jgi:hypothetical protein
MENHVRCSPNDELIYIRNFYYAIPITNHNFYLLFKNENNKKKIKYSAQFSLFSFTVFRPVLKNDFSDLKDLSS